MTKVLKINSAQRPVGNVARTQRGVFLIEALVSILIFTIGIIGLMGLQATSIKQVGQAKYRIDAANFADQVIGEMWSSDHTVSNLQSLFASPDGLSYLAWKNRIVTSQQLPGVVTNPPVISIVADATDSLKSQVVVTVNWQAPGETTSHNYTTTTEIR